MYLEYKILRFQMKTELFEWFVLTLENISMNISNI